MGTADLGFRHGGAGFWGIAPILTCALAAAFSLLFAVPEMVRSQSTPQAFLTGIRALDAKDWSKAIQDMEVAVGQAREDGKPVRIYGMRYQSYLPHYYEGLAYYHLKNCRKALEEWDKSLRAGAVQKTAEFSALTKYRIDCQTAKTTVAAVSGGAPTSIGLAALHTGELLILVQGSGVFMFSPSTQGYGPWGPGFDRGGNIDVAVVASDQVFMATFQDAVRGSNNDLARFDRSGVLVQKWSLSYRYGVVAGVAVDSRASAAYFSTARQSRVYRLDLNARSADQGSVTEMAFAKEAETLGAIALDEKRGRIFVADPIEGSIYVVQFDGQHSAARVGRIPEPDRMAIDPVTDRLLILDSSSRTVYALDLGDIKNPLKTISRLAMRPSGLAVGANGTFWTTDPSTGIVAQFSRDGRPVAQFVTGHLLELPRD